MTAQWLSEKSFQNLGWISELKFIDLSLSFWYWNSNWHHFDRCPFLSSNDAKSCEFTARIGDRTPSSPWFPCFPCFHYFLNRLIFDSSTSPKFYVDLTVILTLWASTVTWQNFSNLTCYLITASSLFAKCHSRFLCSVASRLAFTSDYRNSTFIVGAVSKSESRTSSMMSELTDRLNFVLFELSSKQ